MIYKTITKLICSKLGKILPQVVSQNQGAFTNDGSIISNILLFRDPVKRSGKSNNQVKGLLMKVDLRKAYDSVERSFVQSLFTA